MDYGQGSKDKVFVVENYWINSLDILIWNQSPFRRLFNESGEKKKSILTRLDIAPSLSHLNSWVRIVNFLLQDQ